MPRVLLDTQLQTVIGEKVAISPLSLGVKTLLGEQISPGGTCADGRLRKQLLEETTTYLRC